MKNFQRLVFLVVISIIVLFFFHEFFRQWNQIKQIQLTLSIPLVFLAYLLMLFSYLLSTIAWKYTIDSSTHIKISMLSSIAVFNSSGLAKYIPGKIWVYGLQILWMSSKKYSKSLVLYVGLINTIGTLFGSIFFSASVLFFTMPLWRNMICIILLLSSISLLILLFFSNSTLGLLSFLIKKTIKREIVIVPIKKTTLLKIISIYIFSAAFFGFGGWVIINGAGIHLSIVNGLNVAATLVLTDVVSFLAFFSPGGFGIRESLMYLMLQKSGLDSTALLIPLLIRIVSMTVDLSLGITSLFLLKNMLSKTKNQPISNE